MSRLFRTVAMALSVMSAAAHATTNCVQQFAQCAIAAERVGPDGALTTIRETWEVAWFEGFVIGVGLATINRSWCPPAKYSSDQVSAAVSRYVQAHPERWSDAPEQMVVAALGQYFPCKSSSKR